MRRSPLLLIGLLAGAHPNALYGKYSYEVPEGRGSSAALDREREEAARLAEVYASTPAPVETRQQRRARERAARKGA